MVGAVKCKLSLYADDSALLISGKNVKTIELMLGRELQNISAWLVDNKLSLHLGKTESLLFGSRKKLTKCNKLDITCNGINIGSKSSVSYLGADLDQSLTWESMGLRVIKKANSRLKFLYIYIGKRVFLISGLKSF